MEGEIRTMGSRGMALLIAVLCLAVSAAAQEKREEAAELQLQKTPPSKTRQYEGKAVEGDERVVNRGESLWRILIQDRGLSEKRFNRYLVVVKSLNPHIKSADILQVGDTIFIPHRPDEILGIQVPASGKGETKIYRVKRGDYLYKILREQFGVKEGKGLRSAVDQVKGLNREKQNWNLLIIGEGIVFPGKEEAPAAPPVEPGKPMEVVGLDYGRKIGAQENLEILEQVMGALGNETRRGGEEVVPLKEGTVHIDRDAYPVIQNPKMQQKVILDLEARIPQSLRTKMEAKGSNTPVVSVKKGANLHETVSTLLSRLGFQSLPANRPVVIQDGGVGLQVKGEWMVTAPEASGRQEVFVISLTDGPGKTPDYLTDYLSFKGMNLKEILLPSSPASPPAGERGPTAALQIEDWPRDRRALVDAFLNAYQISFSTGHQVSLPLRQGIRMDTQLDRYFEFGGKKMAILFQTVGEEVKKALQEKEEIRAVEMDLNSLTTRDLLARLLETLGERTAYGEHRFPAVEGRGREKVVLTVAGFFLPHRSLLLTDREIPKDLQRFFSEKGLRVVHFY